MAAIEKEMIFISRYFVITFKIFIKINKSKWYYILYFINFRMIDSVDILTSDHTQKGIVRNLNRTSVSFLDPSMKNNTASILKSTRVRTIPFKRNYPCAFPINYPSGYSGKHINSPVVYLYMHVP